MAGEHDEELLPVPLHRSLNRDNLFLGGDREIVMMAGLISGTLIFFAIDLRALVVGVLFWIIALFIARLMAKSDPKMRFVYLRHRIYKAHYPPRASVFRKNTDSQGRQYRNPWK